MSKIQGSFSAFASLPVVQVWLLTLLLARPEAETELLAHVPSRFSAATLRAWSTATVSDIGHKRAEQVKPGNREAMGGKRKLTHRVMQRDRDRGPLETSQNIPSKKQESKKNAWAAPTASDRDLPAGYPKDPRVDGPCAGEKSGSAMAASSLTPERACAILPISCPGLRAWLAATFLSLRAGPWQYMGQRFRNSEGSLEHWAIQRGLALPPGQ
ncbi:hypothetical protein K438DRAFT_1948516 [Mycena galopus ATCC 62051]|nr:hypothetical protein K438DRAFT_1948516 [Mycena galopus ATCC 62051]